MQVCNNITLIGNVGQAPTIKTLPSGTRLAEFSLATNDSYRNRDGEKVQRTEWHRIHAFGKVVDVLERYVTKGNKLAVSGTLRYNKWTDSNGQSRTTAQIMLEDFQFIGGRGQQTTSTDYQQREATDMVAAEPEAAKAAPAKKTRKRRTRKADAKQSLTPVEDLPF
jgi:single-strand DNA-binding protein